MNYFFVFLIQTLLPFSLLLACSWVPYPHANRKKLVWLAILGFIIGSVITLSLPNTQSVKLTLAIFSLGIFLFAYVSQCIHWQGLTTFWHVMLAVLAGSLVTPLLGDVLLILMKLQVIELTKVRLSFVAKSGNITTYLNYINAAILAITVFIFALNIHHPRVRTANNEQQPIEKRKALAAKRTSGKVIGYGITAIFIMLATQLYWDKIASQPPQLSEAQRVTLDAENNVHIPIEQVKDGKLHRFLWVADDGKAVRFFIINRLPDELSLAAVFDACILCGDQGYVMEGNQVVCVGCGVRMFTPSIGKPGGCNPVPIDNWKQTETEVIINKKNLEDGLNYFTTIIEIEVVDPVNGKKLTNTKTEFKYNHEGRTYFFTDEKNLNLFRDNPEAYLNKADEASTAKEEK